MRAPWFLLLIAGSITASAAIIDAIAITVGNQAITEREIDREIRLAALINEEPPDFTIASRRKSADRLIEQALVRREMEFGAYPAIPPAQIDSALANTEKARGGPAALTALLEKFDLTHTELRDYLGWQLQFLNFIDLRFRPAVQVTNEDVEKYYRDTFAATRPGTTAPPLKQVHDQIEQKLSGERVDRQLDEWIARSRSRTVIRYIDTSLGTTANAGVHVETAQPH